MREAFAADSARLESLTEELPGLYLDLSKQRWDSEVKDALIALAKEADVTGAIRDLFGGVRLNTTEDRAVLHMALRADAGDRFEVDGNDVLDGVIAVRSRMLEFVDAVHGRHAVGEVTDVVNIGIGGSDLGPAMAVRALRRCASGPVCHFV
ncbi:MAG: glucose-6-phosphate isomerase, partial [Flavobacteriales bacterium]